MRSALLTICCLSLFAGAARTQEVVISGFPVGVGGSIGQDFFEPYYPEIQALVDTLHQYSLARAIITGGADGIQYRQNNDAKNPALALGRAHALRNLLMKRYGVDSAQIEIRTEDVKEEGPRYRYASVRIEWEMADLTSRVDDTERRLNSGDFIVENFGLRLGAGISTSPFGGMPIVTGALIWKNTVFVEAIIGHTFWNEDYQFQGTKLDTWRRMAGGQMIVYPLSDMHVGIVGGWVRVEEISRRFYDYVRMSEGLIIGARASLSELISVTGAYNPSKHRVAGNPLSRSDNDQFMLYITANISFGGGK